ncbi:MAG: DUF2971 domain-containing protein [Candidatus Marinimicrobia bacterium]|nr:DUF2971 domain-containing protein [Candidatus Neomarinimicrobiota bacterium]
MENRYDSLVSKMVDDGQLPKFVYRMVKINQHLYDGINNSEIWFSNPTDFNDPFDCDININMKGTNQKEIQEYFQKYLSKSITNREKHLVQNLNQITILEFENLINIVSKRIINRKGVACFLSSKRNLLMWSHYADSHKGVCLKFSIKEDLDFFSPAKKVNYENDYPKYNYLQQRNDFVKYMFFTKSKDWEYEGEVRVFKNKSGNYKFKKEALKELIFGCRTSPKDIKTITILIKNLYPNASLKIAKKKKSSFGLDFETIN